uniref:Sushi domain-containing protein n=1 Tax=Esox lucius TaxID=8010 RepID=A0AAY5KK36_ESOLU
ALPPSPGSGRCCKTLSFNGSFQFLSLICLPEVDCGSPPALPHSVMFWDQRTNMGSEVFYQCNFGYKNVGEGNVSHCNADGQWDNGSTHCCIAFLFFSHIVW